MTSLAKLTLPLLLAVALPSPLLAADAGHGKSLFGQCAACHTIDKTKPNGVGPNLFGVVDRPAASAASYPYSASYVAAKGKGLTWSPENIIEYLADPAAYMRKVTDDKSAKTKMIFKMPKEADRADVVEYLKTMK